MASWRQIKMFLLPSNWLPDHQQISSDPHQLFCWHTFEQRKGAEQAGKMRIGSLCMLKQPRSGPSPLPFPPQISPKSSMLFTCSVCVHQWQVHGIVVAAPSCLALAFHLRYCCGLSVSCCCKGLIDLGIDLFFVRLLSMPMFYCENMTEVH